MILHANPNAADNLFRPADAARGTDAEKLYELRKRLQLRKREHRLMEQRQRNEKRVGRRTGMF